MEIDIFEDDDTGDARPDSVAELMKTAEGRQRWFQKHTDMRYAKKFGGVAKMVAWDGEGVTVDPETREHWYILFGNSLGNRLISKSRTLDTREILNFLLEHKRQHPNTLNVAFAFSYDVEMILADLSENAWRRLNEKTFVKWAEYTIRYVPGKWFSVSKAIKGQKKRLVCQIWDLFGFFQTSFVNALHDNLPNASNVGKVEEGKGKRNTFTIDEFDTLIEPYWEIEIDLLAQLAEQLRKYLLEADLPIQKWHGPGAIADLLFKRHNIREAKAELLEDDFYRWLVLCGFAGGRFEQFRVGRARRPVHVYDINSAHPSGIVKLPDLSSGNWIRVSRRGEVSNFGIYAVHYDDYHPLAPVRPQPFFFRDERGCVNFPRDLRGSYWTPEIEALDLTGHSCEIIEGFELVDTGERPFAWVEDMYHTRQEWKRQKRGAQMALKLGLNSLFGKTAQRVGWERNGKAPSWHQLEWAGYITSNTRSILWPALWQAWIKRGLIAVETDSVITMAELDLPISKDLGGWGHDLYDDCIFLQNGVYMLLKYDGCGKCQADLDRYGDIVHEQNPKDSPDCGWIIKFRGLDRNSFSMLDVLEYCDNLDMSYEPDDKDPYWERRKIVGQTTRFVGSRAALHVNRPEIWRTWQTMPREISIGLEGKRTHHAGFCSECTEGRVFLGDAMHVMRISSPEMSVSSPHYIPWIENEEMARWGDPFDQREAFTP